MLNSYNRTHYLRHDLRVESLTQIIIGLDNAINILKSKKNELSWYDGLWFMEESESIYGLAFIAFQNYIISSIKDFANSTSKKHEYYKLEPRFKNYEASRIQLIIGLANYSKHKDEDGKLLSPTKEILESFNLSIDKDIDINSSPVFKGLTILNEKWNLFEIMKIVTNWRELLWNNEIEINT